jgi:hypothetical protein
LNIKELNTEPFSLPGAERLFLMNSLKIKDE